MPEAGAMDGVGAGQALHGSFAVAAVYREGDGAKGGGSWGSLWLIGPYAAARGSTVLRERGFCHPSNKLCSLLCPYRVVLCGVLSCCAVLCCASGLHIDAPSRERLRATEKELLEEKELALQCLAEKH